jgi:hypothetical protein
MPTPTYISLATVTLGSSSSSVTLSSIPGTYRDLVLISQASVLADSTGIRFRFNGDSGFNYPGVFMESTSFEGPQGGLTNTNRISTSTRINELTTNPHNYILQIMDYSASDKHKVALLRSNGGLYPSSVNASCSRWANTSVINSINISPNASSFAAGSTFNLYGIAG